MAPPVRHSGPAGDPEGREGVDQRLRTSFPRHFLSEDILKEGKKLQVVSGTAWRTTR